MSIARIMLFNCAAINEICVHRANGKYKYNVQNFVLVLVQVQNTMSGNGILLKKSLWTLSFPDKN